MHVERFYTIRRVQQSTGRSDETVNLNILPIRNLNTTVPEDHSQYDVSTIKIRRLQRNNCRTEIFTLDYSISQGAPLVTLRLIFLTVALKLLFKPVLIQTTFIRSNLSTADGRC